MVGPMAALSVAERVADLGENLAAKRVSRKADSWVLLTAVGRVAWRVYRLAAMTVVWKVVAMVDSKVVESE